MAHFAEINKLGIVTRVVVTDNNLQDEGLAWLEQNLGGTWIQTSYNTFGGEHLLGGTPLRKNFAGIGFAYNSQLDAFIPPKPYPSWLLDETTCLWVSPATKPKNALYWDEDLAKWIVADL